MYSTFRKSSYKIQNDERLVATKNPKWYFCQYCMTFRIVRQKSFFGTTKNGDVEKSEAVLSKICLEKKYFFSDSNLSKTRVLSLQLLISARLSPPPIAPKALSFPETKLTLICL